MYIQKYIHLVTFRQEDVVVHIYPGWDSNPHALTGPTF